MSANPRRTRARRSWPQRLLIGFNVMLIVASLTVAGGLGYLNLKLDQVPRLELGGSLRSDAETDLGGPQNYLIVGTDSADRLDEGDTAARGAVGLNSDTLMLLRVDPDETQAQLLSLPRDLYVEIPGGGEARINSALNSGGPGLLLDTIQTNFDVPVDHYLEVDFKGFKELVAAVDGVPVYFDTPVRDPKTGLNVERPGCKVLDPDRALAYARSRSLEYFDDDYGGFRVDGSGDLGRISRQQDFIRRAVARAVAKGATNPVTLSTLVDVAVENVRLDSGISAGDILALGRRFRGFNDENLRTMTFDVANDNVNGQSILRLLETDANSQRLDIFRGAGVDADSIQVVVQNGSGTTGQGAVADEALQALGFLVVSTGDADRFDYARSVVRYEEGSETEAQFVAQQVAGGADLEVVGVDTIEGANVALITGLDFTQIESELVGEPPAATAAPPASGAETTEVDPAAGGEPTAPTTTIAGKVPEQPAGVDCG